MSETSYLSGWKSELCIQFETEGNDKADFNRLLVKGFPATEQLQQGGQFKDAGRAGFILQLKGRFDEIIEEGGSHSSLCSYFKDTSQYLRWCDKQGITAFTQLSVEGYM